MDINAFGLIEVQGLVTAIEAADAMLKSASVKLIRQQQVNPGLITLIVEGDLAACRAAVDAGVAAAARLGTVVSRLEIGRPDDDTERMILALISRSDSQDDIGRPAKAAKAPPPAVGSSLRQEQEATRKAMLDYIVAGAKGRSWMEIVRRFPEYAGDKPLLEEMVKQGVLRKAGNRYLEPLK